MSKRDYIKVQPSLPGRNNPKIDPDVDLIMNPKKKIPEIEIDILGGEHQTTQEEKDVQMSKSAPSTEPWSWLIIILAFIVVVLIVIIVWYVLKENEECDKTPTKIHSNIIQPNMVPPNYQQMQRQQMQQNNPMYNTMYNHPMHPQNRPQTENLPIQTKSMSKQPTKNELMSTLNKMTLEPIKEGEESDDDKKEDSKKILKSSEQQSAKTETDPVSEDQEDTDLANKFYQNLQQNIDNEEADDSDHEDAVN